MGIRSVFVVLGVFLTTLSGFAQSPYFGHIFRVLSSRNQSADPDTIDVREALLLSVNGGVDCSNSTGVAVAITLFGTCGNKD